MGVQGNRLKELENALRVHAGAIQRLLTDPRRAEKRFYLPLAGELRVLLCDKDVPILLEYSRAVHADLSIFAPETSMYDAIAPGAVLALSFMGVGWDSTRTGRVIMIEDYLDQRIGAVPASPGASEGKPFTPRSVIKWLANKEGVAHLDFEKPGPLASLKSITFHHGGQEFEGIVMQRLIYDLSRWAFFAICYVLQYSRLEESVSSALSQLESIPLVTPQSFDVQANYKPRTSMDQFFEGEHFFRSDLPVDFSDGFVWFAMIRFPGEQYRSGTTVLYEAGMKGNSVPRVRVEFSDARRFRARVVTAAGALSAELESTASAKLVDSFLVLGCELVREHNGARLMISVNGQVKSVVTGELAGSLAVDSQVVGGDFDGGSSATFSLKELLVGKGLVSDDERLSLAKYLWLGWHEKD